MLIMSNNYSITRRGKKKSWKELTAIYIVTLTKVLILLLLQSAVVYFLLGKILLFAESRSWKPVPKH